MKMEQFQDVELVSDGEIISCHKLILALHSEYFRTFFSMNMSSFEEVDRNRVEIMCIGPDRYHEDGQEIPIHWGN